MAKMIYRPYPLALTERELIALKNLLYDCRDVPELAAIWKRLKELTK